MGKTPHRPDTSDPALHDMIERYVREALKETGTASPPPRDRMARGSEAPAPRASVAPVVELVELVEPSAPPDLAARDAAELARELEAAMSIATLPSEFVDETPTDVGEPPLHIPGDEEATGVYSRPPE